MLTEELKDAIQQAYSRLLNSRGFKARQCQKLMIAHIARVLGDIAINEEGDREPGPNTCVIEAGTGTGKTIAYILAGLPLAKAYDKTLIISTATVALQEQIMNLDLPDIRRHADLNMTFALAKGRRRYLCLSRLEMVLQQSDNKSLAFFDDEIQGDLDQQLYRQMQDFLNRGGWNGERDDWPDEIPDQTWASISTDHVRCTGRQCSHYANCIFYRAREQIHRVDCIITNHDLVLTDLIMGGGAVLPAPEDAIYIFDEGHHLPDKATSHFSEALSVRSTQLWLQQITPTLQMINAEIEGLISDQERNQVELRVTDLVSSLETTMTLATSLKATTSSRDRETTCRFPMGVVPEALQEHALGLERQFTDCHGIISDLEGRLQNYLEMTDSSREENIEQCLPVLSSMKERLASSIRVWSLYRNSDLESLQPYARWMEFVSEDAINGIQSEVQIHASPISVSDKLQDLLWSRCFGVVVTSATLSVAGDFSRFQTRSGIDGENQFTTLPSPFNFQKQGLLRIPSMDADPGDPESHTQAVTMLLPQFLEEEISALVLFTSWRQMLEVAKGLDNSFSERVLRQGLLTRSEIIRVHRERIDAGQKSCIFGLSSFAEGIDLPGHYCEHVVISKIPFPVPNDPVGATMEEWIKARGGNAFQEIMIPDAALRMVQACGRLLRTETDTGTVTILDRRLVTRHYGNLLQRALPPFRKEIGA
ncbi:MAG: ATP-dependent DNA helicase DinG [Gammaproteobacteria bacterium]|nr:ATP-dependent DNA helicase DinG [Gammaproteobacteria bacterium]